MRLIVVKWFRRGKSSPDGQSWEEQSRNIQAAKQWRLAKTATQRDLVADVSRILFEADLIGINFETNTDEYDAEAETIVIGLPRTNGPSEVQALVHEAFVQWFDADTAGPIARYSGVATEIWNAWLRHEGRRGLL